MFNPNNLLQIVFPKSDGSLSCVICQVDREEREWCAGLPTHVFAPWVERLVAQDAPGITAPPLPVQYVVVAASAHLHEMKSETG